MIYFLRAEQDFSLICAGDIKIGTTVRLSVRLKQVAYEVGHEPVVLAVMEGSFCEEKVLHERFRVNRRYSEWFKPCDELLRFIVDEGSEWDGIDEVPISTVTVKMDIQVVEECRIAAAFRGMTLAEYLSETMRLAAKRDIDDGYAQRASEVKSPKGKGAK